MTTSSRTRVNSGTSQVTCTVLNKGYMHLIEDRPTNSEIIAMVVKLYGTGKRFAPAVRLKNGQTIRVTVAEFTSASQSKLEFEGSIPNGGELARVRGAFDGEKGGYIQLVD